MPIDYLRGEPSVYVLLLKDKKNKREVNYIQKAFKTIEIIYIDENISKMAEDLIIKYSKSHNLQINDVLIAALQ